MTDTQLVVATGLPLFVIAFLATIYAVELVLDRLEQIFGRPFERIVQRLDAIDSSLHEANLYRKTLCTRIDSLAERR
ncbi:MAG TPA: hypothetical protein VFN62_09870 [Acidobacteriaceae bacterium]|nr:hypothetical protein [Acidobacteriaceae bacterium]